mgnify:CR=1 FL=1
MIHPPCSGRDPEVEVFSFRAARGIYNLARVRYFERNQLRDEEFVLENTLVRFFTFRFYHFIKLLPVCKAGLSCVSNVCTYYYYNYLRKVL